MCCLTCSYFEATEPPAHKEAREAGRCQGSCGKNWDRYTIFRYVQNHDEPLMGVCRFNPVRVPIVPWDVCAQHRPVLSKNNLWNVRAFDSEHDGSLVEWAASQYSCLKQNDHGWETRHLEQTNSELRQQLAAARKRSASRLARLQKLQKPTPESKLPQPRELRLVAAE